MKDIFDQVKNLEPDSENPEDAAVDIIEEDIGAAPGE